MKILSIGLDKRILDKSSKSFARQREYAQLVDELHIVVFSNSKNKFKSDGLFVYGSGGNKFARFFYGYKTAKKILEKDRENQWVITTQDPFESALLGWLLAKRFKIGLNIQEHGDYFSEKYWRNENLLNFLRYFLGKFLIKRADSIRTVSQRIKNTLISRFDISGDRIIVVPIYTEIKTSNDLANTELRKKYRDKFIFLTMARLVKQKNLSLLIESFKEVLRNFSDAFLLIVGRGNQKNKLIRLVKRLELEERVSFIDWTDNVYPYYDLADVYVLSSNYEGWGLVVIEAASRGLPIIMTDVGCAGEVIKDGESGLVVPLADKKNLAKAMLRLAKDKNLRTNLSKKAKEEILNLPDKEKILRLYKESWQKAMVRK